MNDKSICKESCRNVLASYSLKIVLVITFILAIWKSQWIWVIGGIAGIIIGFIPTLLKKDIKVTLPWSIELLIAGILALHMGGVLLNAYYEIPIYADITQFFTSILVAFLAFAIIYIFDEYWDGLKMNKYAMAFVVVIATIAMGVVWEFNEWITDIIFGTYEQWGYNDTIKDLFIDAFAGILMAVVGVALIKRGRFDELTEELGKQIDEKIIKSKKDEQKL